MEYPDIHFSVTPLYNVKPSDEDFESDMFEFDVEAIFSHVPDQDDDDDDDRDSDVLDYLNDRIPCTSSQITFMVERRVDDDSFRANVRCRLEGLGVPALVQPYLVNRILHEAKSMERDKGFLRCKVICMRFSIDVVVNNRVAALNLDSDDDVIDATMVPASKSSMESLERVNVEGSNTQCSICLEELSARFEAIRLPCSHVNHGRCIRSWLEKSGRCPLCRFVI